LGLRVEEYSPQAISKLPKNAVLIHTIPPLAVIERENLHDFICALKPRRVLYISSTSVYGDQTTVTADSAVRPSDPKGLSRVEEENWLKSGKWANLIVRPAAIYGPGRGVHVRTREGRAQRTTGSSVVSRIHTDDLAAILEAGVDSELEGAYPCGDERPCSSRQVALWSARLLKRAVPPPDGTVSDGSVSSPGRMVDGSRILDLLGIRLRYPDYWAGVLASLPEELLTSSELRSLSG
jgi:nucleoside-diphosphate-sugar epimerase